MPPPVTGPEFQDTGDPEWIEPLPQHMGAFPGDIYTSSGRWRERIPPTGTHPLDTDTKALCRIGFEKALGRLNQALRQLDDSAQQPPPPPLQDPTVRALVAVYDALEWVHSFDEYLRKDEKLYKSAARFDPANGPYVEGAIGARNASHHGVRRVVGIVPVDQVVYRVDGRRWVRSGTSPGDAVLQLRWVAQLPPPPLDWAKQEQAFLEHLAGRDVRNTFAAIVGFFFYKVDGREPPVDLIFTPASGPPPIDPRPPGGDDPS